MVIDATTSEVESILESECNHYIANLSAQEIVTLNHYSV